MSSLINKAKDMLNRDKGDNPESTNYGQHSSNVANKADPRIDSDMDHRNDPTSTYGSNTSGGAYTGNTTSGSTNYGPHSSNLANKMDPRVDSDGDNRNDPTSRVGGYGQQETYSGSGANPMPGSGGYGGQQQQPLGQQGYDTGAGAYGSTGTSGYGQSGPTTTGGPHNSNLMNKMDPRVDSDMDNRANPASRVGGYGSNDPTQFQGGAATGTEPHHGHHHHHHGHHGQQQTAVGGGYDQGVGGTTGGYSQPGVGGGNFNEPGVAGGNFNEPGMGATGGQAAYHHSTTGGVQQGNQFGGSGVTGSGFDQRNDQYGSSATPGSGNAPNTAGPHNSNLLNKLDPRVDSDMDGSKTYGGNKTSY